MRTILKLYLLLPGFLLLACKPKTENQSGHDSAILSNTVTADSILLPDTLVVLRGITKSNCTGPELTEELAKKTLYRYFEKQGYYTPETFPDVTESGDTDDEKLTVNFTKLFFADFNGNNCRDAVITYWLTPLFASGHCWQPHKAIISDTDKGYQISDEEFIPVNFTIDSVVRKNNSVFAYCYDYDCPNDSITRQIRVQIK